MKMFVIEAYGGLHADGPICRFTVLAETLSEALDYVRDTPRAQGLDRFEVVEETPEYDSDTSGVIRQEDGAHAKTL